MLRKFLPLCLMAILIQEAAAVSLTVYSEFTRPDPFGQVVKADLSKNSTQSKKKTPGPIELKGARGGYVSFQLAAELSKGGTYSLSCDFIRTGMNVQVDLFKAWFHRLQKDGQYIPDALIPVPNPY